MCVTLYDFYTYQQYKNYSKANLVLYTKGSILEKQKMVMHIMPSNCQKCILRKLKHQHISTSDLAEFLKKIHTEK